MSQGQMQKQGLVFNTGLGQHILKNPLVVQSMIEKVTFLIYDHFANTDCLVSCKSFFEISRQRFDRPTWQSKSVLVPEI